MFKKITLVAFTLVLAFRCDFYDLEINEDPNRPIATTPDLLLPSIEFGWADSYQGFHDLGSGIMGHHDNFDGLSYTQNTFDANWQNVYLGEASDLDEYLKSAAGVNEDGVLLTPGALGIGEVLKAHIYTTLVDHWGDVPFSEANQGNDDGNVNPVYSDQEVIYTSCLALIDSAIVHFAAETIDPSGDLIYDGNMTKWSKAAKSLKLKILTNARYAPSFTYGAGVAAEIQALVDVAQDELIVNNADNFQFQYNTNQDQGQRHPWTGNVYAGDTQWNYISNQLMYEMLINRDPRIPYYFHRQTTSILDQEDPTQKNTTPCSQNSACIYGYMPLEDAVLQELTTAGVAPDISLDSYMASFFGRDKGDPSGTPLDGALRTAPGIFPMGGNFDSGSPSQITNSTGLGFGDGFTFFVTAPMIHLYIMEHLFETGREAEVRDYYISFIESSMDQVASVADAVTAAAPSMTSADIAAETQHTFLNEPLYGIAQDGAEDVAAGYLGEAITRYDDGGDKESVVYKEAWYSLWGAGLELYNSHRRRDYPKMKTAQSGTRGLADIQYPTFRATSSAAGQRNFPTILPYPLSEFNMNSNFPADGADRNSDNGTLVFWDISAFSYN